MEVKCAYDKLVDVDLLQPHPRNPNKHPDEQIQLLAKIMKKTGIRYPIVVSNQSGFMNSGHGRLMAAKINNWSQYPVDYQDFENDADEYSAMVAANKLQELASTDMAMVNDDFVEFGPDLDTDLLGIPDFEIEPADFNPTEKKKTMIECPNCNQQFEK